ncbi:DUF6344 domain-containing protein [Streptomyces sp. NPDC005955]|jgi:hypothetical protein|uniref:DUF6344 domain-containing protein n=1 Tax=Streptomyces sp. NPDC005955 TaxID=3364738 RepID=UPI0036BA01FD
MAKNKVMALWTALITAVVAVLAALGFASPAAAAPVHQTSGSSNSTPAVREARVPVAAPPRYARSLPPTMKQRIRAEAHGSSPSCRHCAPSPDSDAALTEMVNATLESHGGHASPPVAAGAHTTTQEHAHGAAGPTTHSGPHTRPHGHASGHADHGAGSHHGRPDTGPAAFAPGNAPVAPAPNLPSLR